MEVIGQDATPWMKCNEHAQKPVPQSFPMDTIHNCKQMLTEMKRRKLVRHQGLSFHKIFTRQTSQTLKEEISPFHLTPDSC